MKIRPSGSQRRHDDPGHVWLRFTESEAAKLQQGVEVPDARKCESDGVGCRAPDCHWPGAPCLAEWDG